MKTASRKITVETHSRRSDPQFFVKPGEEFLAETELCTGPWLTSPADVWSPEKATAANPAVCIGIDGAMPGDMLAVRIIDIVPDRIGYTGFTGDTNPLAHSIRPRDWGLNARTVEISGGLIHWSGRLKLPVSPMIGTIGTAPAFEELANVKGGPHGGNMDVNEARAGSTLYLPVSVPGALLHIGDAHAIQGDGEINCAGGIECRATVRLSVEVRPKPAEMEWVRIEDAGHIMAVACCRSAEESFHAASGELLAWMTAEYGFTFDEAYLLMGQVMEARCTQFVNPTSTYICKMAKKYLVPGN